MRNLFICHTQAQLTLASGLALGRFKQDVNELILYLDFSLAEDMRGRIKAVFHRVLFLQGIYPKQLNTYHAKLRYYPKGLRLARNFLCGKYDHAFVICDTVLLTQKMMQHIWHQNPRIQFSWLEDGITAYYRDTDAVYGLDRNAFTLHLRSCLFKCIFGVGHFYNRDFSEVGGSSCITDAYVLFPHLTREPYRSSRQLVGITPQEYHQGLQTLYSVKPLELDERSIILVVDLLSRYKYPIEVRTALDRYIHTWQSDGYTIYCKFHPREEQPWDIFDTCRVLESSIGIESIYLSLFDRRESLRIVGIKSTGLMSAKLLGFDTLSLFPISNEKNDNLISFYQALGIRIAE